MTTPQRRRPVPRLRVLAGALALLATLTAVAGLAEWLRHPHTLGAVPELPEPSDPRDETVCPPPAAPVGPFRVASEDLYDCPHTYDGETVTLTGEVVGAVLYRGDTAWAQLNDDAYAGDLGPLPTHRQFRGANSGVGVLLPRALAATIDSVGAPKTRGDVLTITGTYHLSDPATGEVAIIHAASGELVQRGESLPHPPLRDRQIVAGLLALAALASLGIAPLIRRRRSRDA